MTTISKRRHADRTSGQRERERVVADPNTHADTQKKRGGPMMAGGGRRRRLTGCTGACSTLRRLRKAVDKY